MNQAYRHDDNIRIYDDVMTRFGESSDTEIQIYVATALFNKGVALASLGRSEEAVAAYGEVVKRYGDTTEPVLAELVRKAFVAKVITLGLLNRYNEVLALKSEEARLFGKATKFKMKGPLERASLPEIGNKEASTGRRVHISDISIPDELGYVIEKHGPTAYPEPPTIVHIQEAFANYGARKNEINILEWLIEQYGLRLILVEGGNGDVGLAYLRAYGPPENRKVVVEKYFKSGILSPEEYVDIVSDHLLSLWGVDDKSLHRQQVEALLNAEAIRGSITPLLALVRQAIEELKPRLADPEYNQLVAKREAFEQEELSLGVYIDFLADLAKRHGIAEDDYSNIRNFQHARNLERIIRLDQIPQEVRALIVQLSECVEQNQLIGLIDGLLETKTEEAKSHFYDRLEDFSISAKLDLRRYPNASAYIRYLRLRREFAAPALSDEIDELGARLLRTLGSVTPQTQEVYAIEEQLHLIAKFVDLSMSPEEYRQLKSSRFEGMFARWMSFLRCNLRMQDSPATSFANLDQAEAALSTLQRYYQLGLERRRLSGFPLKVAAPVFIR